VNLWTLLSFYSALLSTVLLVIEIRAAWRRRR
jgi:hypothetical protein